jgi:solute carrier family 25 (mitochondrial folate transporter), member 32
MTANLMGLSHVAVQFPVYEWLKINLVKQRHMRAGNTTAADNQPHPNAMELFLASGLSKMTASLLTYPHEVVRSRMMDARGATGVSLLQTMGRVYAQDGMLGFYSGLPVALIRVIPNCCITFMSYEFLLRLAKEELRKRREERGNQA